MFEHADEKCTQCEFIHDRIICPQCGLPVKTNAKRGQPLDQSIQLVNKSIGTGRSVWSESVKGMMQILAELQAKTHVVKYCKEFSLPAIWESTETDSFDNMRWFNRVVTGLEYNWIMEPNKPRAAGFVPSVLISDKTGIDVIACNVLEITMYLPANHIYSVYLVIDTTEFAEPSKHAPFSLEKILKSKLNGFQRKAIVMRYRGRGSKSGSPVIRVSQ